MKPQKRYLLYIICILCALTLNTFGREDETKTIQTQIENQTTTPTLEGMKLVFSSYTNGSPAARAAIEKSIPQLKITDEIHAWLKTDAAKSPNKDIRMLTLRIVKNDSPALFNPDFSRIFLYDPDEKIRLENIKALKGVPLRINSVRVYKDLFDIALTDGYYPVRKTVLEALAQHAGAPQIIEIILKRYPLETSMTLQFDMEQILTRAYDISDNSAVLSSYLTSDLPQIRALICRVIGKSTVINNTEALKKLKDDNNNEVAASRDWALKQLQGPSIEFINFNPAGKLPIAPLANRRGTGRSEMLRKYDGDDKTESSAQLGLKWLAANQEKDGPQGHPVGGSWNCARHNPWHNNVVLPAFTNEDELVNVSVSALSLLCFLGDGSTHQSGLYQDAVKKGLEFIKTAQDQTGCINIPKGHVHNKQCLEQGEDHGQLARRYNHNISTLFLVELYAMTGDAEIKDMAQRALEHSRNKPEPGFPWSFYLEPTDMGPSIFYILALRIAQETDLLVSAKEIDRTKVYLDRLTDRKSGRIVHICAIPICFGGMDSTASGLFGHILMKSNKEIITRGANWLRQFPPQWEPFYQYTDYYPNLLFLEDNFMNEWHWYYQTLAFRQIGGDYWSEWNRKHKEVLLKHQRIGGLLDGSWDPEGPWATIGGRVYSTAFSILSLQAYYSYEFK